MQAMILTRPPQVLQVSMSMLNTRFRRYARVIAARRSAGVAPSVAFDAFALLSLPRLAGVTRARCALLGQAKRGIRRISMDTPPESAYIAAPADLL